MATVYTRASKGSALTWAEGDANINNLNNAKIENVVDDTTPQLGGNLDVNGNSIVSASNGNINITPNGTGSVVIDGNSFPQAIGASGEVLTADGAGAVEWKLNQTISAQVYNADSVQINKGEPVYVFGAQGSNISVKRALNTGDATSAQSLGLANENIAAGATGIVICQGVLKNVDTNSYTAGQALYLGATAGSITTTKPKAPNHLVYLGFAETINSVSGRIYVRVQNGYELDEIHDVQITTTPSDGQVLAYESSSSLWKPTTITAGISDMVSDTTPQLGGNLDVNGQQIVSVSNGNIVLAPNGTGKIQLDGLYWPTADGTNGQVLSTDGAGNLSWVTRSTTSGTVTSVSGTGTVNGLSLSGTVTSSGNLTLGGTLDLSTAPAIGGTSANTGSFTTLTVRAANDLRLADSDSSNYVGFKSPATVSANLIWTLPSSDGTNGQVLQTNGSGTLSWATAGGSTNIAMIYLSSQRMSWTGSTVGTAHNETWTMINAGGTGITVSNQTITIPAGTWVLQCVNAGDTANAWSGNDPRIRIRNTTDNSTLTTITGYQYTVGGSTTRYKYYNFTKRFTIAAQKNYVFQQGSSSTTDPYIDFGDSGQEMMIMITKVV